MPRVPEYEWRQEVRRSELSYSDKLVAYTMALYMTPSGTQARPGNRRLKLDTGLSIGTVGDALKRLEETKWLILTKPGSGRKADEYEANVPGDIWDEIVLERPEEQMRRDKTPKPRSDLTQGTQTPVATPQLGHKPDFSTDRPSERISDLTQGTQNRFARGLRAVSDPSVRSHLDLDLKKNHQEEVAGPTNPRSLGTNPRAGFRDPALWQQALELAHQNGADNPTAYANKVYARLHKEHQDRTIADRHQTAIDLCDECSASGYIETDQGFIRHDHGE